MTLFEVLIYMILASILLPTLMLTMVHVVHVEVLLDVKVTNLYEQYLTSLP